MHQSVLAIAAHPDDIELVMAGTLMQLQRRGWQVHYFNIANGCCGSTTMDRQACARVRLEESRRAAELLPASFYPPICNDLEILYSMELLYQVAAVVRAARPSIILTHALVDYMEDHQFAARLAVSAAFVRGMPNVFTNPPLTAYSESVAVYHAQPHGNREPMGNIVIPTHFVDVSPVIDHKRTLLACHESQDQWLDQTQGISAYLETMLDLNREVASFMPQPDAAAISLQYAEGWRQHLHMGLSNQGFDPLSTALSRDCYVVK